MAFRSAPDADGWISITSEPMEEKDLNTLVAAAMEKPAASEQAAANAPAEEAETVETCLLYTSDLHAADLLAHFVGGVIKGSDQLVTIGVGGDKTAHGLA